MTPSKTNFKVFIACENHTAYFQTRRVQHLVEACCGHDAEISRILWSFALLRNSELRRHATREAAEAEMIVISLLGNHALPLHVKRWMQNWPARSEAVHAALVILVGPDQKIESKLQADIAFLRNIAESHRLDFFCNWDGWERLELAEPAYPVTATAQERAGFSSYDEVWRRGGINE